MSIPLVQEATKDAINTSIIAIKRNIERINMLLGLSSSEEIDTSIFATKEELQALEPVNEVAVDNMHSVTSNAVASSLSYSTTEVKTGAKWIDGKPIYRKVVDCGALPNNTTKQVAHNISNVDRFIKYYGTARANTGTTLDIPYLGDSGYNYSAFVYLNNTNINIITKADRSAYVSTYIVLEYTKTTD